MKKSILFFAAVCFLFFYSCDLFKGKPTDIIENSNQIILDYTNKSDDSIWTSNKVLQKWHKQYLSDSINATYKKSEAPEPYQYVDFKLEELKHLIWLMEKSANDVYIKNEREKPELGLRVYYTQYTEEVEEKVGLNSVVLSPIFKLKEKNELYNPRNPNHKEVFIPWDMNQQFGGSLKGANPRNLMMLFYSREDEGTNLNHGVDCPKYCN